MKKKLASLLVLALVFTMLVPAFAFAAVPSDVSKDIQKSAVAKLMALGVVKGYEDGTIRPDNNITRAEFTKTLVEAAGFGKTATLLGGTDTKFKDVTGKHWAAGHIAVAANKGWVKGVNAAQTQFAPEANVTYAEAITMVLRVLGYKEEGLIGTWPTNYIIQANELGLLEGINFSANTKATRGDVFVVIATALEQELVTYDKDKARFDKSGKLLISDAFGTAFDGAVVTAAELDKDGKISLNGTLKATNDLVIEGGKALSELLGHKVEYLTVGGKVVYVRDAQVASEKVTGTFAGSTVTGVTYSTLVDLGTAGKFNVSTDSNNNVTAKFYVNNVEVAANAFKLENGKSYTVFLSDSKVRAILASKFDVTDDVVKSIVKGYNSTTVTFETYGSSVKFVNTTKVTLNGASATVADLAVGDVVSLKFDPTKTDGTVLSAEITRNTVTGKVTYKSSTSSTLAVNGTTYTYVANASTNSVQVNAEYTLYLNASGKVVFAKAVTAPTSTIIFDQVDSYAVLDGSVVKTVYDLVGVKADGTKLTLRLNNGSVVSSTYGLGDVLTYTLSNGVVTNVEGTVTSADRDPVREIASNGVNTTYNRISFTDSSSVYVSSSTVFIDVTGDAPVVTSFDKLAAGQKVQTVTKDGAVTYVYVTYKPGVAAAAKVGVFTGLEQKLDGDKVVTVAKFFVGNEVKEEKVEGTAVSSLTVGSLYVLGDDGSNSGTANNGIYDKFTAAASYNKVTASTSSSFKVQQDSASEVQYRVSGNTKFYLVVTDANGNFVSVDTTAYATLQTYTGADANVVKVQVVQDATYSDFADSVVIYVKQ